MSSQNVTSAGVFAYGCPPEPEAPPRAIPYFESPVVAVVPCAKCRRHVYVGMTCPFCYADALKDQRDEAERDLSQTVGAQEATAFERDQLKALVDQVIEVLGGSPVLDSVIECAEAMKRERDEALLQLAEARAEITRVHAERVAADRRVIGLRRDLAKLLAEHGGAP